MQLGRVIDQVVSTVRHPSTEGHRLLVVKLVTTDRQQLADGPPLVAVDTVGARAGQLVITCEEGRMAQEVLGHEQTPVRTLILGIVDE